MTDAGRAAMNRQQNQPPQPQGIAKYFQRQAAPSRPTRPNTSQLQGNMSEDEALARALQASLAENSATAAAGSELSQEEQDRMLALSLAQGDQQLVDTNQRTRNSSSNDKSCQIS